MRIALIQNHPVFGEKKANVESLIAKMNSAKADLYILPELSYSGYQFVSTEEAASLADPLESESIDAFRKASRRLDAGIVFGFPEKAADGRLYNASLAILPDGREYLYRKTHLFYKERLFFSPGDLGFTLFEFRGAKVGMAICFDWFFPESFRTLALEGADIIAHCSNLVMLSCQQSDFAQAVQNRVFIATANRVGTEAREAEALTFTGESVLVSPKGEYLLRGPKTEEAVLVADIDPSLARNKRINAMNDVFAERRPEFYTI
ncbi:MAG: nitrilase-related carbon-nitrogen hydrolase [Rectinemataceae bacterium]|nr:nitrilase-related carbon-nitrogen hydrolase [Rectinemataceae bacterium]